MRDYKIPQHTLQGLERYVKDHTPTGSFLEAVLSNDLFKAVEKADYLNLRALVEIVKYIYNEIPVCCWGSSEKYEAWVVRVEGRE